MRILCLALFLLMCLEGALGQLQGITNQTVPYAPVAVGVGNHFFMPQQAAASDGNTVRTGRICIGNVYNVANLRAWFVNSNAVLVNPNTRYDQAAASSLTISCAFEIPVAGPFTVGSATNSGQAIVSFTGSPGWAINQFTSVLPNGSALNDYTLGKITGGSDYTQQIISNTSNSITLNSVYGTAPVIGDQLMVYKLVQCTFGGSTSVTLSSLQTAWTDPLPIVATWGGVSGEQAFIRVASVVPTSATVFDYVGTNGILEGGYLGADRSYPTSSSWGSARMPYSGAFSAFPRAITGINLGVAGSKCIGLAGDSITLGTSGSLSQIPVQGQSAVQRALTAAGVNWVNMGASGETAQTAAQDYSLRMQAFVATGVSRVILCYGRNDGSLGTPRTAAQIEGDLTTLINLFHQNGIKVCLQTLPPYTGSSDSFATTANQAVQTWESNRLALNAWMRPGGGGAAITDYPCLDMEPLYSITRSSDGAIVWKPYGTADGTHPSEGLIQSVFHQIDLSGLLKNDVAPWWLCLAIGGGVLRRCAWASSRANGGSPRFRRMLVPSQSVSKPLRHRRRVAMIEACERRHKHPSATGLGSDLRRAA